jgi:hypothetical protein
MKTCKTCGKTKPRSFFWKNSRYSDGLFPDCKYCKQDVLIRDHVRYWTAKGCPDKPYIPFVIPAGAYKKHCHSCFGWVAVFHDQKTGWCEKCNTSFSIIDIGKDGAKGLKLVICGKQNSV